MGVIIPNIPIQYQRSFRLLFSGNLCQRAGYAIILSYTSLYLYRLGATLLEISLYSTLPQIVIILAAIPWGRYSDRTGEHRVPIILGSSSLAVLMIFYFIMNVPWYFIIATCLAYIAYAPYIPIANAYSTMLSEDRGRALGILLTSSGLGWFTGSVAAGFVFDLTQSFQNIWLMALVLFLASSIQFFFLANRQKDEAIIRENTKMQRPELSTKQTSANNEGESTYRQLLSNPIMLLLLFAALSQSAGISIFTTFYGPYFIDGIGGDEMLYGLSQALPTLIGTFLVLYFGSRIDRNKKDTKIVLLYSFIAQAVAYTGLLLTRNPYLVFLLWSIPMYPGVFVGGPAIINDNTSTVDRSKGMTLFSSGSSMGRILGPTLATFTVMVTTLLAGQEISLLEIIPLIIFIALVISIIGFICAVLIIKRK
ncbi:MAG: MFS transporter [Candidatus Ranarchaeia archaeon]